MADDDAAACESRSARSAPPSPAEETAASRGREPSGCFGGLLRTAALHAPDALGLQSIAAFPAPGACSRLQPSRSPEQTAVLCRCPPLPRPAGATAEQELAEDEGWHDGGSPAGLAWHRRED